MPSTSSRKLLLIAVFAFLILSFPKLSSAQTSCVFNRSIYLGAKGDDVACLQYYLQSKGYFSFSGGITGYFGQVTKNAVIKWQTENKVSPAVGFFGTLSRTKYQEVITAEKSAKNNSNNPGQNTSSAPTSTIPTPTTLQTLPVAPTINKNLLTTLPNVSDEEILIDPGGVKTVNEYIDYFLTNSSKLGFDGRKFETILKDRNGVFLLAPQLIEKAFKEGVTPELKNSLLTHKEFIEAKIVFLKSIKVFQEAVGLHKKMVGFDKLTLDLIQKVFDLESGTVSKTDLETAFKKYEATADFERNEILKKVGLIAKEPSLIKKIITWLGLEEEFFASAMFLPFGGPIGLPIYCTCSFSWLIFVGPPVPPGIGSLYVPISFIGSPLFYSWKSMRPGAWWLGLYSPVTLPCMQYAGFFCFPIGFGNLIFMAGTSM